MNKFTVNIEKNQIWIHNSNKIEYKVLMIANTGSSNKDYPPTVVYKGKNGFVWTKDLTNFLTTMSFSHKDTRTTF